MATAIKIHADQRWVEMFNGESFWADPRPGNRAELMNIPFFAYNLNMGDVVSLDEENWEIEQVVTRGGQKTFRLIDMRDGADLERINQIVKLWLPDAKTEGGFESMLAVSVPDSAVPEAQKLFVEMLRAEIITNWEHGWTTTSY
jgi:hypothetical protein